MLARKQQIHQVYLSSHAKNSNPFYLAKIQQLQQHYQQLGYGIYQAKQQALADFYNTLQNQASMLSYLDIVVILGVASLCMVPLVFLMKKPKQGAVVMH